jgi:pimeloyl-ACP methyl ester carboxylesterase
MDKNVTEADVVGKEHWTKKGSDVDLFLWEKYVGQPAGNTKGTVLFVHGSSMASTPTFDLHVEGRPFSSAMNWFACQGYDTWCVDMEGYGRSTKTRDIFCDIANGADDPPRRPTTSRRPVARARCWSTAFPPAPCARPCSPSAILSG